MVIIQSYIFRSTRDQLESSNDYKKIYRPNFHHIKSTHAGNLSFIVTTAGGYGDTVLRLWKITSSTTTFNMNITNSTGITLATGTTLIPSTSIYLDWLVMNDDVNGTLVLSYPNFSSDFPLTIRTNNLL